MNKVQQALLNTLNLKPNEEFTHKDIHIFTKLRFVIYYNQLQLEYYDRANEDWFEIDDDYYYIVKRIIDFPENIKKVGDENDK